MLDNQSTHPFIGVAMFFIVWFLYLHITSQWKTSEDLEVYETEYRNPTHFHEVCHTRQPVLFMMRTHVHPIFEKLVIPHMQKYYANTVCIRDVYDIEGAGIELPLQTALTLTERDHNAKYISESNQSFVEESCLGNVFLDDYVRPPFTIHSSYDVLFGSKGASTPLRYHTKSMKCLLVTHGSVYVKLTPWKSRKFLFPTKDYNWYEFRCDGVDLWKSASEYSQIHCLDLKMKEGMMLYIPPYWFYTIQYSSDNTTTVASMEYVTVINTIANGYDLAVYYANLQGYGKPSPTSVTALDSPVLQQSLNIESKNELPPMIHPSQTPPTIMSNPTPPMITPTLNATVLETPPQKNDAIVTNVGVYHT